MCVIWCGCGECLCQRVRRPTISIDLSVPMNRTTCWLPVSSCPTTTHSSMLHITTVRKEVSHNFRTWVSVEKFLWNSSDIADKVTYKTFTGSFGFNFVHVTLVLSTKYAFLSNFHQLFCRHHRDRCHSNADKEEKKLLQYYFPHHHDLKYLRFWCNVFHDTIYPDVVKT